jgi:RecB family exonuclease
MTRQSDRSRKERLLLHLAAGSAERALFVSYPRMDIRQGRARVPSFYALDILRAVEGQIPNLADLERKATGASMSRLGWPSPVDPGVAIDDAEYDLATIGMLTGAQLGSDTTGGQGHYLIGANPCLARSLRTRAKRWRKVWSGADGIVDPDTETLRVLADERPTARSYSATALETFASCPYRFLLHAIHRLHPMEDVAAIEQIDPLTRGGLFHTIQFRVLTDLGASGLLPVTPANHGEVRKRADTVLDAVAVESYERLAPAIDRIWDNEIEDLRTDLRGWIRQQAMAGRDATEWKPAYFEFGFGMTVSGDHDPASTTDEAVVFGDIRLRGSIDLVETHTRNDVLRITDHKTGRAPARPVDTTGGGEVLQPILYAAAAEALLERPVATSGLSYCTERGEYRRVDIHVDDRSRDAGEEAVRLIDQSIKEGFLPASPREGACAMCDFKAVCGPYEERRTALKRPSDHHEQVDRLRRLRRQ